MGSWPDVELDDSDADVDDRNACSGGRSQSFLSLYCHSFRCCCCDCCCSSLSLQSSITVRRLDCGLGSEPYSYGALLLAGRSPPRNE